MLRVLLLSALVCGSLAFAPNTMTVTGVHGTVTTSSSSTILFSDVVDDNNDSSNNNNDKDNDSIDMLPLALKFAAVMGIKSIKDVIQYPAQYVSDLVQSSPTADADADAAAAATRNNDSNNNNDSNSTMDMPVLFLKLMAVLSFKTIHDALYYPSLFVMKAIRAKDSNNNNNNNKEQ